MRHLEVLCSILNAPERSVGESNVLTCIIFGTSFFFCSVDATAEVPGLGRLVNHSKKRPNLKCKVFHIDGTARLFLVAIRDIEVTF